MSDSHASPTSQSSDLQSEEDDLMLAQKNMRKLTTDEVKTFRDASVAAIAESDGVVEGAVRSFFENRTVDCQKLLNANRQADPLAVTGAGLIAFLRYLLSMEQEHADVALRDINEGSAFSGALLRPEKGVFSKIGSSLGWKKAAPGSQWLSPGEYRAKTVHTESQALRALVLLLQANVVALIKAGLALRRAYHGYTSLYKEREERQAAARAQLSPTEREELGDGEIDIGLDRNSLYSVDFGLGAINIAISILPDGIRKMIRSFGFVGDRAVGVAMEKRCMASSTLLSPFASALLLAMLGALPLSCTILYDSYSVRVRKVMDDTLQDPTTKNSLLHLWLVARAELVTRDLDSSNELMMRCVRISEEAQIKQGIPQLRNFVIYDLTGTYMIQHEWEKAREAFDLLLRESKWSDIFYSYGQACCYEMMAFLCEQEGGSEKEVRLLKTRASEQYWRAVHQKGTKMGGKLRAPDQLFGKRLEEMLEQHGIQHPNRDYKEKVDITPMPEGLLLENAVPLPAYEILFVFGLALRIPHGIMKAMVANIDTVLVKEGLVKSRRGVQEAHRPNAESPPHTMPVEQSDDEEADEENYRDGTSESDMQEAISQGSSPTAAAAKDRKGGGAPAAPADEVLIPLQVAAINQANDKFADTKGRKPANGVLACNYLITALSGVKANLLANSEDAADRSDALKLIDAMLAAPAYKDKDWSLSFVQPKLLYEKACILYKDGDGAANCDKRAACESLLREYDRKYSDTHYYTHSMTEFQVHLAKCEFRDEKHGERRDAKKAKHADPAVA